MPTDLRRDAQAKKLIRIYTKLQWEYEHRLCQRLTKLRHKFQSLGPANNSLTSLSDETSMSFSLDSSNSTNDHSDLGTDTDDIWSRVMSSPSSVESISWPSSDDAMHFSSSDSDSSSSGYGGDDDSDFESDMLDPASDDSGDNSEEGFSSLASWEEGSEPEGVIMESMARDRWGHLPSRNCKGISNRHALDFVTILVLRLVISAPFALIIITTLSWHPLGLAPSFGRFFCSFLGAKVLQLVGWIILCSFFGSRYMDMGWWLLCTDGFGCLRQLCHKGNVMCME